MDEPVNIVNDVIISGNGFSLGVTLGELQSASALVQVLYKLRGKNIETPYPLVDDDDHLAGFVIPAKITSVIIQSRVHSQIDLMRDHHEMLQAQAAFFKSHTDHKEW